MEMRHPRWARAQEAAVVEHTGQYQIEDCQACGEDNMTPGNGKEKRQVASGDAEWGIYEYFQKQDRSKSRSDAIDLGVETSHPLRGIRGKLKKTELTFQPSR